MRIERKQLGTDIEKSDETNKWRYVIRRNNSYDNSELFKTDYIYNTHIEATKAVEIDGKFDEYLNKMIFE
jgi:hypothetical protein